MFLFTPCRILVAELHIINFWNNLIYIYRHCRCDFFSLIIVFYIFVFTLNSFCGLVLAFLLHPIFIIYICPDFMISAFLYEYSRNPKNTNIFQCSKMLMLLLLNIFINKLIRILKSDRIYCILMEIIFDSDRLLFLWIRQTFFISSSPNTSFWRIFYAFFLVHLYHF